MPWTAPSGNVYNLCLLDTNALSEILKNRKGEAIGFMERYSPGSTAPCMTVYNYIELRRHRKLFEKYLEMFSVFSNFLLKPHRLIIAEEVNRANSSRHICVLLRAFSPLGPEETHGLRYFIDRLFEMPDIVHFEKNWRNEENTVIQSWLYRKSRFQTNRPAANAKDADRYVKEMILDFLESERLYSVKEQIAAANTVNLDNYPSIQIMLYSEYYRIFEPNWQPRPQEVTDTYIMAATPYVDIVITERYQAEILKKLRNRVAGLDKLQISTLRDIRLN